METASLVVFIILYTFFDRTNSFSLHLSVDNGPRTQNLPACQLVCDDLSLQPSNTRGGAASSGSTLHSAGDRQDGASIERMTLFKVSQNSNFLLAEVSSAKNIVSQADKSWSVEGLLSSNYGTLQVDLFDPVDCTANFKCQVLMSDSQMKVRELTNAKPESVAISTTSTPTYDMTTTSAVGLTTFVDGLTTTAADAFSTTSASVLTAPSEGDQTVTSDKTLDLTPHLLTLMEDLKAEVAILQTKFDEIHFIEERLSDHLTSSEGRQRIEISQILAQVVSLKDDITSQVMSAEERIKDDLKSQVVPLQSDIVSSEQRVRDELSNVEQSQRMDNANVQQSLTGVISATEQRLTTKMSEIEGHIQLNYERELSRLEDKMDSTLQQTGDTSSCSESLFTALKDDIKKFNGEVVESVTYNISTMSRDLVGNIEDSYGNFVNASNTIETRLDQVFDSILLISQSLENDTCKQDLDNFREAIRKGLNDISSVSKENLTWKHSECKRDMIPIPAPPQYPYPVFYTDESSIIDKPFLCDTTGGWIVIQRRQSGKVSFYRDWEEYKVGFGPLDDDFWLGLEPIHKLTTSARHELRIDLTYKGNSAYALYSTFSVGSEGDNFRLDVGGYSGTAGDSLTGFLNHDNHDGMEFSTMDKDNDKFIEGNCASEFTGAWWYNICHSSNLNGQWLQSDNKGLRWEKFTGSESASFSEMKIRKISD